MGYRVTNENRTEVFNLKVLMVKRTKQSRHTPLHALQAYLEYVSTLLKFENIIETAKNEGATDLV